MDMPALCPQNALNFAGFLCGLKLCRLLPSVSCCEDGLNLSLVLESCNVLGICQTLSMAIAMEGFPHMTPGSELLMPGRRN